MKNWSENILYSIIIMTESCWLAAIFLFLNELLPKYQRISIIGLLLAYPFAFIFNRFLHSFSLKRHIYLIANIIAMIFSVLFVLKIQLYASYGIFDMTWFSVSNYHIRQVFNEFQPDLIIILGNCILFWRGWSLSREKANFSLLSKYFQFGFMILLLVFFISHLVDISLPNVSILILAFSFLALFGFGLFRSAKDNNVQEIIVKSSSQILLIVVVLIVLLGLFVGSFLTPDLLDIIFNIIKWIGSKISAVFIFLINLFPYDASSNMTPPGEVISPSPREEVIDLWSVFFNTPTHIRIIGQKIFLSLFMIGMLIALYRLFVDIWHWMRRKVTTNFTVESIDGNLLNDLFNSLLHLLRSILNIVNNLGSFLKHRAIIENPHATNSIRQIYRNLLRWGTSGGYPRHASETPFEYLETMRDILPANEHDMLSHITNAYIVTRYGKKTEGSKLLLEIKECWNILKKHKLKFIDKQEHILTKGSVIIGGKK